MNFLTRQDVSVCVICYDAVNEVERLSDYKSSLNMRDNHPLVVLQKTMFPKMEEITTALSKLGEAIDKNPKDQVQLSFMYSYIPANQTFRKEGG